MRALARAATVIAFALTVLACGNARSSREAPLTHVPTPHWRADCLALHPLGVGAAVTAPSRLAGDAVPTFPGVPRGIVIIGTIIDAQGAVCDVHVMKGVQLAVNRGCENAVRQWKFSPARLHGEPRAAFFYLTIRVGH